MEKESVFMQMHTGKRTGEGSFNVALKGLFYIAGAGNRKKLVQAFPEFFGDELPEFGIVKSETTNKTFKYKGWLCEWDGVTGEYSVYTPDESELPKGYWQAEYECSTKEQCKQFIDSY